MAASLPAPRSILFVNVSRIGDTLLCTPALRALARAWPDARLDFLGHPARVEMIEHLPFVSSARPITKNRAPLKGWLAADRYDLALVCGFDRPLVSYALRAARRVVAFSQENAAIDRRLAPAVPRPAFKGLHAAEIPLLLTRAIGVPDAGLRLAYAVTGGEKDRARATLKGATRPLVGLQVASFHTKSYRDWPLENFAELCARITQRWPSAHFLFFGGEPDRSRTAELAARVPGRASDLAGRLTLRESAALMNELDLYVGVDTGPTHVMGALDRPMIALYHCYSPSRLLKPLERAGLYAIDHPGGEDCGPETPMSDIAVDAVWERVLEALGTP